MAIVAFHKSKWAALSLLLCAQHSLWFSHDVADPVYKMLERASELMMPRSWFSHMCQLITRLSHVRVTSTSAGKKVYTFPRTKMLWGKEKRVKIEVIEVDLKNFPAVHQLPGAPSISQATLDLIKGPLERHRDEFRRMYNGIQQQVLFPSSLQGRPVEVDTLATALSDLIPVTTEYIRLKETFKNHEQISQNVQGPQTVYWMGITATFGGSRASPVLVSSIKEGTKSFYWDGPDLRSNINLPVKKGFSPFHHKHASVEKNEPLRFFLSHHWKPRDERTISSEEDKASTLASAELPLENICSGGKPCTIRKQLPFLVNRRKLGGVSGGQSPCMNVKMSIRLEE